MQFKSVVFVCLLAIASGLQAQSRPIWVIGHMANSEEAVQWVADSGGNGIEVDLNFNVAGFPTVFKHGGPLCDCNCAWAYPSVCKYLKFGCETTAGTVNLLRKVANLKSIGLVIIDCKTNENIPPIAAGRILPMLDDYLFGAGYQGNVIISVAELKYSEFLETAAATAKKSPYAGRIYFSYDQVENDTGAVVSALTRLTNDHRAYGTGWTACLVKDLRDGILMGYLNEASGVVALDYIWSIDRDVSIKEYLRAGADAIVTNRVDYTVKLVHDLGYTLAAAGSQLRPITSSTAIGNVPTCRCTWDNNGCVITAATVPNSACECVKKPIPARTCGGTVVACKNLSDASCKNPGTDKDSCLEGGGNCGGYQ